MNWAALLNFFPQSIPIWDMAVIICIVWIGLSLRHIKELLNNHVTDTNKKIDKLEGEMKEGHKLLKDNTDKRFEAIDRKIDRIIDKISEARP